MGIVSEKAVKNVQAMMRQAKINAASNTDEQAYSVKELYDHWPDIPDGTMLEDGQIVSHSDGKLYRVMEGQGHKKNPTWAPDVSPSVFQVIPKLDESGTADDPIQWASGMIADEGKYYTDEGVLYLCIESSGIGLQGHPKDLARYFKAV